MATADEAADSAIGRIEKALERFRHIRQLAFDDDYNPPGKLNMIGHLAEAAIEEIEAALNG